MKILVIGGSYFFGRWFVQLAHEGHEVTVLNRGNIRTGLEDVKELRADRHSEEQLRAIMPGGEKYDAVVDFCAYSPGDIASLLKHLDTDSLNRYIFISTVDVYRRGTGQVITEESPLEDRSFGGEEGAYITGKVLLESELLEECIQYGISPVSVRPAILYGPGNYAPRESMYFKWIEDAGQIIHPEGADGFWQMLYVRDAAQAVLKLCEMQEDTPGRAYNLCNDELITYDTFEAALDRAYSGFPDRIRHHGTDRRPGVSDGMRSFVRISLGAQDMAERGIQLPFPLSENESERYCGRAFKELKIVPTPLFEGLAHCIRVFKA